MSAYAHSNKWGLLGVKDVPVIHLDQAKCAVTWKEFSVVEL